MKPMLWAAIGSIILSIALACVPYKTALSSTQLAALDSSNSVALVESDEEETFPFCSGVWVSKVEILTAAHCIESLAQQRWVTKLTETLNLNTPQIDPMNMAIHYIVQSEVVDPGKPALTMHSAFVVSMNTKIDLALLHTISQAPNHSIASLARVSPPVGSTVSVASTVHNMYWSYRQGILSSYREDMSGMGMSKISGPFIQFELPLFMGDSGGGLFNEYGELIGISSFVMREVPELCFAVHIDTIRGWLIGRSSAKL